MRMPFGRYRGLEVDDLPRAYLEWLQRNVALREPLASAVAEALDGADENALSPRELPPELKPVAQEVISTGFRLLALKLHPDVGGDHKQMVKLNKATAWLRKKAA